MSEYQCYEFVAIDQPLTPKQMAELRAISTRAEITSTRFWNEYQWGDLKADPAKLVERYFDAHMYFANWGTHRLILRVPLARMDAKMFKAYFVGDTVSVKVAGKHLIFDLHSEDEEPDYDEESQGSLAALTQLRAELLRGDLRVAYLAWLLAVQAADVPETDTEPPVPAGLAALTAAQATMAEFLRIDGDLISAAAEASEQDSVDGRALRNWVRELAPRAKDEWLLRAASDPNLALGGELLRAFRGNAKPAQKVGRRTVADLLVKAEAHRERRERTQAQRAAKAQRAAETARTKRLDRLATRVEAAWKELEALVEKSAYDDAIALAIDLRDLAKRDGMSVQFAERFEATRKRQLRRRAFFARWKRENEARR
ncbi:hypothetical protein LZC95_41280 [Pendulispora brunnea]|uniref:Uncharacterized protein n=1 Tax=Pendulispora brunnea TaxID=2905690 RepID=A0ABZ2K442_9BACT